MKNKLENIIRIVILVSVIFTISVYISERKTTSINFNDANAATVSSTNWDGWVKLGGSWQNSAFVQRNEDLAGFSWGASPFGWMSMSGSGYKVYIDGNLFVDPPSVDLAINGSNLVRSGENINLVWRAIEIESGNSCSTSDNSGTIFSGRNVIADGGMVVPITRNTVFSISCRGLDGSIATDNAEAFICGGASGRVCPATSLGTCNTNSICEATLGETRQSCPADCKTTNIYREN